VIDADRVMALRGRIRSALHNFQRNPTNSFALACLGAEVSAWQQAVDAGAIAVEPLRASTAHRRLVQAVHQALEDVERGDDPTTFLTLARQLHLNAVSAEGSR
jgi:hypothetical protein